MDYSTAGKKVFEWVVKKAARMASEEVVQWVAR
jgi:hypothetical protein